MILLPLRWRMLFGVLGVLVLFACTEQKNDINLSLDAVEEQLILISSLQLSQPIRELVYLTGSNQIAAAGDRHVWVLAENGKNIMYEFDVPGEIHQISGIPRLDALGVASSGLGVSLLDAREGELRSELLIPDCGLLAMDPTGRWAVIPGSDTALKLIDLQTGDFIKTLMSPVGDAIEVMAFSQDGSMLLTADAQGEILVWDVPAGQVHDRLAVEGMVNEIAISADNRFLAVSHGRSVSVFMFEEACLLMEVLNHGSAVMALSFSPDSQWLATGGADHIVRLWRTEDWSIKETLVHPGENHCSGACGEPEYITAIAISPDSRLLFSADNRGVLYRWQILPAATP